jgi:hypothetical protein
MKVFPERSSSRAHWVGPGGGYSRGVGTVKKEEQDEQGVKRAPSAGVHVALAGSSQVTPGWTQKKCKFADVAGSTDSHPPWLYRASGTRHRKKRAESSRTTSYARFVCSMMRTRFASPKSTRRGQSARNLDARGSTLSGCMRC